MLPVLAEVVRSGFVEGMHRGSVVALDRDGSVALAVGQPEEPIYPRSSNKPFQAVGMLRCGLDLPPDLLALATASHSGEPIHIDGVRRILASAGLAEEALQTPPDLPYGEAARRSWLEAGLGPQPVAMNCSGKHAAMLATCVVNGWPVDTYREPEHPLQLAIRAAVTDLTGEEPGWTGVDGCGAPLFAMSLTGLARGYRAWALAGDGSEGARLRAAVRSHPLLLGGTGRDVTELVAGVPGLVAKDGAEAVYAAALDDGRAVALKVEDGGQRARPVVMAAALRALGVEAPVLAEQAEAPVLGGGAVVGEVRAVRTLFPAVPS